MLGGWYCRSLVQSKDGEESQEESVRNYKPQYRALKRKLKFLIYENESFQETLKATQRSLLKANRDRSFLLDRLLQYEKVDITSSESEETESSDEGDMGRLEGAKRKKQDTSTTTQSFNVASSTSQGIPKIQTSSKKKRLPPKNPKQNNITQLQTLNHIPASLQSDGHMTPEEVERHLESRQTYLELVPERAPPTVPTEMFSNDPSLDSESNEICEFETSPSNLGDDCLSIDMMQDERLGNSQ